MNNRILLATLHTSLTEIKKKLRIKGIANYSDDISRIEDIINQYPKLSRPQNDRRFRKIEEPEMLQALVTAIKNLIHKINQDLSRETQVIEAEMHGTQNFSEYELKRTDDYVLKKEFENELQKMLAMIGKENMELKELNRKDLHLVPNK